MCEGGAAPSCQPFRHGQYLGDLIYPSLVSPRPIRNREGALAIGEPHLSLVDIFAKSLERDPPVEKIVQVEIMEYPEAGHGVDIGEHPSMKQIVVADIEHNDVALRVEV